MSSSPIRLERVCIRRRLRSFVRFMPQPHLCELQSRLARTRRGLLCADPLSPAIGSCDDLFPQTQHVEIVALKDTRTYSHAAGASMYSFRLCRMRYFKATMVQLYDAIAMTRSIFTIPDNRRSDRNQLCAI